MHTAIRTGIVCLLLVLIPASAFGEKVMPSYDLTVDFNLETHTLRGLARISLPAGQQASVNLEGLRILAASVNDRALITEPGIQTLSFRPGSEEDVLEIAYMAEFAAGPGDDPEKSQGVVQGGYLAKDGIALTDGWYPSLGQASRFRLTATLPEGFEGISEAEEVLIEEVADGQRKRVFVFPHPLEGIHLIAAAYHVERETHEGTEITAYFLPENRDLAKGYISHAKRHLDLYAGRLGPYPFRRFAIVENILPSGYAAPTFTLLGTDTVKLPPMSGTPLGDNILRQWLGMLVSDEKEKGIWSEGLTAYLAGHISEELQGRAWDFRKQTLISYQSYVNPENDFSLSSYKGGADRTAGAIGNGKAAMVFHMLRKTVGDDIFFRAVRDFLAAKKFSSASWEDIRTAFESAAGRELGWFFRQWTEGTGALRIEVGDLQLQYRGAKSIISFPLRQKGGPFRAVIPLTVKLRNGELRKDVEVEKETTVVSLEAEGVPVELVVDPDYDLFRSLSGSEFPPVASRLFGDSRKIFVLPGEKSEDCKDLTGILREAGFQVRDEQEVTYEALKASSFMILGKDTALVRRTLGKPDVPAGDISFSVFENPLNRGAVIGIAETACSQDAGKVLRRLADYGKYSRLAFSGRVNVLKGASDSDRGMHFHLTEDVIGVEIPRITKLSSVIDSLLRKKIIYVGEGHDRFEHHRVQLDVIRELHRRNPSIAIGMEMFQKPFQSVLDEYIAGTIDEKEFLKKSEYFKRWGFDYNLYREILLYAREFSLPVAALNIPREAVSKVSKGGIHSLGPEDQKGLPEYFDLSDEAYRLRLRSFFERHQNIEEKNFDFFFQAQVLWDESMAQNLTEFMEKHPEHQMVVIAGTGHMAFGSGIPGRAYKRNGKDYAIILNGDDIEEHVADYVLFPAPLKAPESPKLMILFREEEGKIVISGFPPDSLSERAGIREGDVLLSIDDAPVGGVDDIKIFLLYKKKGDTVRVKVSRKRFFFGPQELEFPVTL